MKTLAGAVLFFVSCWAQAQVLGFGSAPQGSIGYNMSSAIAKVMAEDAKLQSRVQPYSGSSAVLPLVNSGELDLAVCNVLEIEEATKGEGPYNGRKQQNLRVLAVIFPLLSSIFVRNCRANDAMRSRGVRPIASTMPMSASTRSTSASSSARRLPTCQ